MGEETASRGGTLGVCFRYDVGFSAASGKGVHGMEAFGKTNKCVGSELLNRGVGIQSVRSETCGFSVIVCDPRRGWVYAARCFAQAKKQWHTYVRRVLLLLNIGRMHNT